VERTNIPGYLTNNPYWWQLWNFRPGSILTYPSHQSDFNKLAILQSQYQLNNSYQQLIFNTQAQQRHQNLASILAVGAIPDGGDWEMAERSQRIERRINEAGKIFDRKNCWYFTAGSREQIEDKINTEFDTL
jgi:hypothetical protein